MSMQHTMTISQYVRARILHDHLEEMVRRDPKGDLQIADGLAYASAISLLNRQATQLDTNHDHASDTDDTHTTDSASLPGGLCAEDVMRFGHTSALSDATLQSHLVDALKTTLLSILEFWSSDNSEASEDERLAEAERLPDVIAQRRADTTRLRTEIHAHKVQIQQLVHNITETHPRLEAELLEALAALPPTLHAQQSAQVDLLGITIETSLRKLSLLRARAHSALYTPALVRALLAARRSLAARERAQAEEERRLDAQIASYEDMLRLVDGPGGGFGQVVEDMARVKRETEECRRDLRRLGWTGD